MKITPLKTNDGSVSSASKVLCYGHHGAGKTSQIKNYARAYGKGLVLSGESGLSAISDIECDYIPFETFDRPAKSGAYSFKDIVSYVNSEDFKAQKYKWIAIDSATELSQRCMQDVEREFENSSNGFEKWGTYERKITAALKWVRDLPMHVLITALAAEENDDNGITNFWPMLTQKKVQKLVPALYDHVFCLVRKTTEANGRLDVKRYLITEQVHGWHGKSRDPHRRLRPVEDCDDITELLARVYMTEQEFNNAQRKGVAA